MKTTALITGASAGIGRHLATVFASAGHDLILVARSVEKLEELGRQLQSELDIEVRTIGKDLAAPNAPRELFEETSGQGIEVDYLVNNAGFGHLGRFHESDLDPQIGMIELNVTALTKLTWLFVRPMLERDRGGVLNVASTAAFQPGPLMSVYYATKAFVLHFSEGIANELESTGVTVTALCPGPTATSFQDRAGMADIPLTKSLFLMSAEKVARAGYDGMMEGKRRVIPGTLNKIGAFMTRLGPRDLSATLARKAQEPRRDRE